MATDLTTIFGDEIKVVAQPHHVDRQYVGLAGANGLLSMLMGTRGRQIIVTGRLWAAGTDYADARSNLQVWIDNIDAYRLADAADYSFKDEIYQYVVFDKFQLVPDATGKAFHQTNAGYVTADFICYLRSLI